MSDIPIVSIIVRTKNREVFLKRAILSIINQTYKNWKAYIINDGGTNDYIDIVAPYIRNELKEKFIFVDMPLSSGRGGALSTGLNVSSEKYILIHDDDDTLEPDFLAKTVNYLEDDEDEVFSGVTTSNYDVYEELKNGEIIINKKTDTRGLKQGTIIDYSIYLSYIGVIIPISFLFKRDSIKKIGNIDTNLNHLEDYDFFIRLMQCGEIGIISDFLCSYHHRKPSGTSADTSRHEKKYDYHLAYRNNIIRAAIENKSSLKNMQSHFIHGKTINDFHTHHLQQQIFALTEQFSQLNTVLQDIVRKVYE